MLQRSCSSRLFSDQLRRCASKRPGSFRARADRHHAHRSALRQGEALLQEHLGVMAQTQLGAPTPDHDQPDDVGRIHQEIRAAGALIEA